MPSGHHHPSVADLVELILASPHYVNELSAPDLGIAIDLPEWAPPEAAQVYVLTVYDSTVRGRLEYPPAFAAID